LFESPHFEDLLTSSGLSISTTGTISNAMTRASGEAHKLHKFRKKISRVNEWLSEYNVPDETCNEVQVR
jgi:hypothetical protein